MISVKLAWYRLLFTTETAPTKMIVATASIFWGLISLISEHFGYTHIIHSVFIQSSISILFVAYGIALLWRIVDGKHRPIIGCVITLPGAALWVAMTWAMVFAGALIPEVLAANIAISISACWLFIRAGSGEIIFATNRRRPCTITERETCESNVINIHRKN